MIFDIQNFNNVFGLFSSSDKSKLDYLYNNAVVSWQADSSNTTLMSASGNVVAVIPVVATDSDDIVTPIVQEESQISLSSTVQTLTQDGNTYSATVNTDEQIFITVTTRQDDECSFTITENTNSARNNLSYSNGVITGSFDRSGQIQATVTRTGTDDSVYLVIATSDYDPNSSSDPGMPPMP